MGDDDLTIDGRRRRVEQDQATAARLLRKLIEAANPGEPMADGGIVIDAFVFLDEDEAELVRRLLP